MIELKKHTLTPSLRNKTGKFLLKVIAGSETESKYSLTESLFLATATEVVSTVQAFAKT